MVRWVRFVVFTRVTGPEGIVVLLDWMDLDQIRLARIGYPIYLYSFLRVMVPVRYSSPDLEVIYAMIGASVNVTNLVWSGLI